MNLKRALLLCAIVFLSMIMLMIFNGGKLSSLNKKDPSSLQPPNQQFEDWRKQWEKQR